ncbi:HAD family hydrolase [Microbacterium sp. P01]|uniref:HAD family hydrolase n=1 Tax=unclassified Microbacterium TaxID=2609290 RepID=UPI00366B2B82
MAENTSGALAVLLDIDGTLVDSNYLHIDAWDRAFTAAGHPVDVWRIHRAIGMDSGKLIERLAGDAADDISDDVTSEHSRLYEKSSNRLRTIRGARELLSALSERGVTVVLATSAPESELKMLRGLLQVEEDIDVVTSGEDVAVAKPDPGIVEIALERAGVPADRAVMVGDSVWDVEAARRAGLSCIGVLSGGYGAGELMDAGAVAVYNDVADLLEHLDDSPVSRQRPST